MSLFSYVAFADLIPNLDKLAANGVEVEYVMACFVCAAFIVPDFPFLV